MHVGNTTLDDGSQDVYLVTPPLPELVTLRLPGRHVDDVRSGDNLGNGGVKYTGFSGGGDGSGLDGGGSKHSNVPQDQIIPTPLALRGSSVEINVSFVVPPPDVSGATHHNAGGTVKSDGGASHDDGSSAGGGGGSGDGGGWDVGVQLLWSDGDEEYTRVGVKDGSFLPGVDLWDEVNGDSANSTAASAVDCREACIAVNANTSVEDAAVPCGAWTFNSVTKRCRFKEHAQRSLLVTTTAGCFTPNYAGSNATVSTSGTV